MNDPTHIQFRRQHAGLYALIGVCLAWMPCSVHAFGTLDDQPRNAIAVEFEKLDSNHDGELTRSEASHDDDAAMGFTKADGNHDGRLSSGEYAEYKHALQRARMEAFLQDSAITARVKSELLRDSGVKGLSISVETQRGIVILSGFVNNEREAHRAGEIASGVRGVQDIKNSLLVKGT